MKKIVLALCLVSTVAFAQKDPYMAEKNVLCADTAQVLSFLTDDYKEVSKWIGYEPTSNSHYSLLFNESTKTWTMIQFREGTTCMIGSGRDGQYTNPGGR